MAAVGNLLVRIGADTGGLRKGGRRAESTMDRMSRKAREVSGRFAKIASAAGIAGAAITAGIVKASSDAITQQTRLARSLDSTNKQVAGLTSAFRAYGLQQEDVGDALNTLSDRAQDAASGMESMADDFRLVGINVDQLRGKKPVELFRQFASSVRDTNDPSKRAAAAVRIFGDDIGRKLLPLLMEGEVAIDKFTKRAEEMGLAVGEVDATKVEMASIAMSQLQEALSGVGRTLTVELAPVISAVAEMFTDAARKGGGFSEQVKGAVSGTVGVIGAVADAIEGVRRAFVVTGQAIATWNLKVVEMMAKAAESILSGPVDAINHLIDIANKIPGVDIGKVEQPDIVTGLREQIAVMEGAVEQGKQAMNETLMEPMPSQQMDKFLEEAKQKSQQAAEEMKKRRDAMAAIGGTGGAEGGEGGRGESEKEREKQQKRLNAIRSGLDQEFAIKQEHRERLQELETLREETSLLTKKEFDRLRIQSEQQMQKRLTELSKQGQSEREKFNQKSWDAQVGQVAGSLQQMTSSVARENKAMFQLNKVAGIASATINAYQGFNQALAAYPPPLSYAMAGAQLASGLAQVQKIKSQSFSGGGGGSGGSAAPAQAGARQTQPGTGAGEQGNGAGGPNTIINLEGETFGREQVRNLIERINEEGRDGGRITLA